MRRAASTMQSSTNLHTRKMPSQKSGSTNPMVAYLNLSLHEDGAVLVQASPSVKNCIDQRFKQQFIGAHKSHVAASSKSASKRQKTSQGRACANPRSYDDDDVDDAGEYPYKINSSFSSQPAGCLTLSFDGNSDDISDCEGTPRPVRQDRSFFIKETDKVTEFLRDQLRNMQQNAVKRLAKAWIKGICPKKQAKFPYHDAAKIPDWWPSQDLCPFKEPDHIKKDHRLNLCMHILRLRPKKGELQAWNEDPRMPAGPYDAGGWTQFLKDAAPIECIKDLREPEELNELRIGFLAEMYKVADKEEEYLKSGLDATDRYLPMEAPQERSFEIRRIARLRIAKDTASKNVVPAKRRHKETGTSSTSKGSSPSNTIKADPGLEKPKKKRARRDTGPSDQPEHKPQVKAARPEVDTCAMSPYSGPMSASTVIATPSWPHRLPPVRTNSLDGVETSFASTTASFCAPTDSFMADSNMIPMATRPVHFQTDIPMTYPTYSVTSVSQPTFRTVPNSPITPHISLYGYNADHQAAIAANSQAHPWTMNSSFGPASFTSTVYDDATSSSHAQSSMMARTGSDPIYQQPGWGSFTHAPQVSSSDMRMSLSQPERTVAAYSQF